MKKLIWGIVIVIVMALIVVFGRGNQKVDDDTFKIGFIGDMSMGCAKYASYEAVKLAENEINAKGGIDGKKLEIIYEDGKCNGKDAAAAASKLVNVDKVKVILGGHSTPESAAMAPIVEKARVVMLASITSSPVLTNAGEYVFRTTPVSTVQSGIIADYAKQKGFKKVGVIVEQTDYAKPIAEQFKTKSEENGIEVSVYDSFSKDQNDFRSSISKVVAAKVDGLFVSVQRPEAAVIFLKQAKELGFKGQIFGNDQFVVPSSIDQIPELYEGVVGAQPLFDEVNNEKTKKFKESLMSEFGLPNIPNGIWTAESYDAVYIIADALKKYGNDANKIKDYLENLTAYEGASGKVSIDPVTHDGIREYFLMHIKNGKKELLK